MHEYSVVQALLEQCEVHASANDATKITKVVTKIGRLSGVEPHLLEIAFNTFKETTICDGAVFVMEQQEVVIQCNHCGQTTTLKALHYRCEHCESVDVTVIDGEEMLLMSLEME